MKFDEGTNWTLYHGDCREVLAGLPERSVQCVVTSPPYWQLRDYGIDAVVWADGEKAVWGMEPTLERYIAHTLEVMEAVGRVLRDDGVVWWNLGDSYADDTKWGGATGGKHVTKLHGSSIGREKTISGSPPGSKLLIPHRVAIALQDAGWCVRQDDVWGKKSPMPESIAGWRWTRCRVKVGPPLPTSKKRRSPDTFILNRQTGQHAEWQPCPGCPKCEPNGGYVLRRGNWRHTNAHEYVFMLTKSMGYFCDGDAVKEPASYSGEPKPGKKLYQDGNRNRNGKDGSTLGQARPSETRNPRSVFHLSNEPYGGAHFATFPTKLILPLIQAATSSAGCCPECGQCWAPIVETERKATRPGTDTKVTGNGMVDGNRDPQRHIQTSSVSGYRPTCQCCVKCDDGKCVGHPSHYRPVPCTVLDICNGSGTTGQVARHLGRRYIGIDCSAEYLRLAVERINTPLVKPAKPSIKPLPGQTTLFSP